MTTFRLHPDSTVFTPLQAGMATLLKGLARGRTIAARHTGRTPISLQNHADQWLFCETSGSSGTAKTIRRTPASWSRSFDINAKQFGITPRDSYATLGPLGHSITLYATLEALHIGADLLGLAKSGPSKQVTQLAGTTVIYATPAQLRLLLRGAMAKRLRDIHAVRHVFCGGGPLSDTLHAALMRFFPNARITVFFGASETSFITISDPKTPHGSVGRPYKDVDLRIDPFGEIWVKSPYLFDGYAIGSAQDTRWTDGYLSIGEMGHLDAKGYLFLRGRKSRMVTVADNNVFPDEIETLLMSDHSVDLCAAIPLPDPDRGHRISCVIQASKLPDFADLRRLCHDALGPACVPKDFVLIAQMPLLASGKPDVVSLTKWLKDRA